jgi:hypothetical protein
MGAAWDEVKAALGDQAIDRLSRFREPTSAWATLALAAADYEPLRSDILAAAAGDSQLRPYRQVLALLARSQPGTPELLDALFDSALSPHNHPDAQRYALRLLAAPSSVGFDPDTVRQRLTAQTTGRGIHGGALLQALLTGYPDTERDTALYEELAEAAEQGGDIGITHPVYYLIRYLGGPPGKILEHLTKDIEQLPRLGYSFLGDDLGAAAALRMRREAAVREAIVAEATDPSTLAAETAVLSRLVAQSGPMPAELAARLRVILGEDQTGQIGDTVLDPVQLADRTVDTLILELLA